MEEPNIVKQEQQQLHLKSCFFLFLTVHSHILQILSIFSGNGKYLPCLDRGTLKTLFQLRGLKEECPLLILVLASREK